MQRTNIYLDDAQLDALDAVAKATGVSRAEVVRQYIDGGLRASGRTVDVDVAAIEESFGALADERFEPIERSVDERQRHLDELWSR